jgi:TonB family protein
VPKQVESKKPVPLPSVVLQGRATQRVTPPYNSMAKTIRLQGEVAVEVIVSPEGRVESARVVKGHPLFAEDARKAALGWRFQPTMLNNIPVRVTGVITFIFRLE